MKKRLSFLLIVVMLTANILSFAVFAAGGYNITLKVEENDTITYSGMPAYSVSFVAQSDSLELKGPQALCFAVDLEVFDMLDRNGKKLTTELMSDGYTSVGKAAIHSDEDGEGKWNTMAFYALSEDGKTGYVSLQPYNMESRKVEEEVALETVLIGLKNGKKKSDIGENAVRLMTASEAKKLGQDVIMLGTGKDIYIYGSINGKKDSELISCGVKTDFSSEGRADQPEQETPDTETAPEAEDGAAETEPRHEELPEVEWNNPFSDVSEDDDYYNAVKFVYERALFNGVSKTRFAPHSTMTRAMFVTVLGRLAGVEQADYTGTSFDDAEVGQWYSAYVEWAAEAEIVNGYGNGKFGVNDEVTIEQAAAIIARYARFVGIDTFSAKFNYYADKDEVSSWATDDMAWITSTGIYAPKNAVLMPKEKAERSVVAMMMYGYVVRFADK